MSVTYKRAYHEALASDTPASTAEIVPLVLEFITPASVVDVGCGTGAWLAEFQRRGIDDVLGFDGPWVDPALLQIPADRFRVVDVGRPIAERRRFDLAVCLEVAEHLMPDQATTIVDTLTALSPVVLFSAAIPFQGGYNHFNEQWPEYWADLFAERGYSVVDCLRYRLWNNDKIGYWYAQNMWFAVEEKSLPNHPLLARAALEARPQQLSIVHPRAYLEGTVRAKTAGQLVHVTLGAIKRAVLSRVRAR